ncbi:MAG: hypothetical protein ACREQL_01425, partial [Candidatus Binatia bacterium]
MLLLSGAFRADAAGPLVVNGAGTPLVWATQPVPFNPDRGPLGTLSNAAAVALVAGNFGVWEAVPSSSIAFVNAGALPVDVKVGNYDQYLDRCDGRSPIIFDDSGKITDDLLGVGASGEVLGFASPECGDLVGGTITEAVAVLNGRWIDGVATPTNPELPLADFTAVFIHEFGHFFNLDHSQIGRVEAFDGDPSNDDAVATMFPFLVNGGVAASLALDDVVSVSTLYPAPGFAAGTGVIRGQILRASGVPFQGAYVVARNLTDPRHLAVGFASGARYVPLAGGAPNPGGPPPETLRGAFELAGLPPGSYTVEVEAIDPRFTSGSGVGPLDPPVDLPAPPEFWNGAEEATTSPPDDPTAATPIALVAGQAVEGIDVHLNEATVSNDACDTALVIPAVPFADVRSAANATTAVDDPVQSCTAQGPAQNGASLWYVLAAPQIGRLVLETAGSAYDTVVSAYTGACGQLVEVACSDDTPATVQSRLDLDVVAGTTLRFEVTAYHDAVPGLLRVALHRGCIVGTGPCDDGDPCTSADACADGICLGPASTCDDGNACTIDRCDGAGACGHEAAAGPCEDGDGCSLGDTCGAATCVAGPRIDAPVLAARLRQALPTACGSRFSRLAHAAAQRFARAARAVE